MKYLFFKDSSKYNNIPYSLLITTCFTKSERDKIIVEFSNIQGNWHSYMPLEEDLKIAESNKEDISFWAKYRKDQKRKEYTLEEFNELFIVN